jgi:hypothetical protein
MEQFNVAERSNFSWTVTEWEVVSLRAKGGAGLHGLPGMACPRHA